MIAAIASALDVPLTQEDSARQLADAIRGRGRTLIILDNFEQVVTVSAGTVEALLRHAPEVVFIVTSRTRLRVGGEVVFHLDPLTVDEAMALFYTRAQAARAALRRTDANVSVIREIVQKLDCMALAVELAAARIRSLTPAQILSRLGERFKLLRSKRRDQTDRQATLRGAIDWSWNLLKPWERAGLAQCSFFVVLFT